MKNPMTIEEGIQEFMKTANDRPCFLCGRKRQLLYASAFVAKDRELVLPEAEHMAHPVMFYVICKVCGAFGAKEIGRRVERRLMTEQNRRKPHLS